MSQGAGSESVDAGRRGLLKLGVGALGVGLAAVPVVPAIGYLLHPTGSKGQAGGGFLPAGKRSAFAGGVPVRVDLYADKVDGWNRIPEVKLGSAWVVERDGALHAYSTVCPHLGCAVDYDPEHKKFKCPCHRSAFALDGTVEEGPSPRPLDALEVKEESGLVSIRFQRFRQGVAQKEPV
ncbi:MAG TPA: Rieske 2Fe-2S domain-containing protein [Nannocystis sp.]